MQLRFLAMMFGPEGPLLRIARANGWEATFEGAAEDFFVAFEALNHVRYHESETAVELGDRVRARDFFVKKSGRVVYLPGVSPQNGEIDHGGLVSVGIRFEDGIFTAYHVDPDSLDLRKGVVFEGRDPEGVPGVPSDEELRE